MTYDTGRPLTDRRGGKSIHTWDLGLRGTVSQSQREILDAIIRARRLKKWQNTENCDGVPLTLEQIEGLVRNSGLKEDLDDLVTKGYLVYRHPRKWDEDGHRVDDTDRPKGYDIATGQLSYEITRLLNRGGIAPTLVPTDVGRMGVPEDSGLKLITATAQGWMEATDGDGVVLNFLGRARGRVQKGKSPTIHTDGGGDFGGRYND